MTKEQVIRRFRLEPLPGEGGFFRQIYPAAGPGVGKARASASSIFYLVTPDSYSVLHRLPQDEIFYFLLGDSVEMLQIDEAGGGTKFRLGKDVESGEELMAWVPGQAWQGTRLVDGGAWALLGVTATPAFQWEDLRVGRKPELLEKFPDLASEISRFTK